MEPSYIADQTFRGTDFTKEKLNEREYEYCTFQNCDFSKAKIFSCRFLEAKFIECNFSNANLSQSAFQEVAFNNCKMLGLKFDECSPFNFSAKFENCQLDHSSFYQMNLSRTKFTTCQLKGVDFTESNFKNGVLRECDLLNTNFEQTNLEKADLTGSFNYAIDPERNRVKAAIFSFPEVLGLLAKYEIKIK